MTPGKEYVNLTESKNYNWLSFYLYWYVFFIQKWVKIKTFLKRLSVHGNFTLNQNKTLNLFEKCSSPVFIKPNGS